MSNSLAIKGRPSDKQEPGVPFAPAPKDASPRAADAVDDAGKAILGLLHQAAGMAEDNIKRALDAVQDLSIQLQGAENRIRDLEAKVRFHHDRAERAEKWLHQISMEIEHRFFGTDDGRRPNVPAANSTHSRH